MGRGPRCQIRVIHEIPIYAPLSGLHLPRALEKEDQSIFQGKTHSGLCVRLLHCQLLLAPRICSHVGRGPRCQIRVIHKIPVYVLFPAFSSLVKLKRKNKHHYRVKSLKDMHRPGLLPTSVSSTRLFACGERTKVSNSIYSQDPVNAPLSGL